MNIFENYQGIYGKIDAEQLNKSLQEFLSLTKDIRNRLGEKGYLLDKYLFDLLETINAILPYNAGDDGHMSSSQLRRLINHKLYKPEENIDHPLYELVSHYIDEHKFEYQEDETITSLYVIGLSGDYLSYATAEYAKKCLNSTRAEMDIVHEQQLYSQICDLLGNETEMERLNFLIRQRFIIVDPMSVFAQGVTVSLLYSLATRDMETDKPILTLALMEGQKGEHE